MKTGYEHHERERKTRQRIGKRLAVLMDRVNSLAEKERDNLDRLDFSALKEIHKQLEVMSSRYR